MNRIFILGLFGGLSTVIYYCLYSKKNKETSKKDIITVIPKKNIVTVIPKKEISIKEIYDKRIYDKRLYEKILCKNILKKVMFNDDIEIINKCDKLIIYKKPKPIYELYIKSEWEIL